MLNNITNNLIEKEITEEILQGYVYKYIYDYPLSNTYVTQYTSLIDSINNYYIVLYKLERCTKEFKLNSINLSECTQKLQESYNISQNIIIVLFYNEETSFDPYYAFYHPHNGQKLNLSICEGETMIYNTPIFLNKNVDEELVKYFANININLFDINDPFFNDICFIYSKDGKDVPLDYRIHNYYQNASLCKEDCTLKGIDIKTYEVECSCIMHTTEKKGNDITKNIINNLMESSISKELFGFILNSNLEVLKCIKKALNIQFIWDNYGGLIMCGLFFIQIIATILYCFQFKQVRKHIFTIIKECEKYNPPKRTKNKNNKTNENIININFQKNINNKNKFRKSNRHKTMKPIKQSSLKYLVNIGENKSKKDIKQYNNQYDFANSNIGRNIILDKNINGIDSCRMSLNEKQSSVDVFKKNDGQLNYESKKNENNEIFYENRKKIESYLFEDFNKKKDVITHYFDHEKKIILRREDIEKMEEELIQEIKREMKEKKRRKKIQRLLFVLYKHKNYNEKEINEMDYDEAIMHDKRNICFIFVSLLRQKQNLINTFCFYDPLKPFSIKLLILIFNFSCYFVINGFLYNEEYISNKLTNDEQKSLFDYLSDSMKRIIYTSVIGGLISFIIGIVFNIENKIENAIKKNKSNIIILRGEISQIYKCNKIILLVYIIVQFIIMTFFTIYIFCFCYVYPNNTLDWIKSSLIVIGIMQSLSFLTIFFVSIIKYIGIHCHNKLCFTINKYLEEQI